MTIAEEEYELRLETFADHGRRLDLPQEADGPFRILAVGEPAPQFLALSNALAASGADAAGAFAAYTAFDYLHERAFDAVVLWAGETRPRPCRSPPACAATPASITSRPCSISRARRNRPGRGLPSRRVGPGVAPETPPAETARRVIELARAYRRQTAIRQALERRAVPA